MSTVPIARFRRGQIVATPNALVRLSPTDVSTAIQRHQAGDWGDIDGEDRVANDQALIEGTRLLSVYRSAAGEKFWVITEADRKATKLLIPEDY